jgi:predicted nucleotidyltransferase
VTDFPKLLTALSDGGVEFILVGGLAATVHGSSRLTQDIDVVYGRSDDNLTRIEKSLGPYEPYLRGAPPGLPFDWSAATLKRGLNFTLTTTLGDIDLLGEIVGGGGYDDLLSHSIEIELFGKTCRCLDLSTLILTKRAAGRPRDLEAVAELEALRDTGGDEHTGSDHG